jgi:hypothetical protein
MARTSTRASSSLDIRPLTVTSSLCGTAVEDGIAPGTEVTGRWDGRPKEPALPAPIRGWPAPPGSPAPPASGWFRSGLPDWKFW